MSPPLASAVGIESFPAAIVFAVLYLFLFALCLLKAIARPGFVFIVLTLFCAIRLTSFILRALLSHVPSANTLNILMTYEILYNVGFFGLLYSAYTLVADRVALARNPLNDPLSRLLRFRFFFRIILTAAVALGITGVVQITTGSNASTINTGQSLRKAALYIFLVCSILVLLQTLLLARAEFSDGGFHGATNQIGSTYGVYILFVISVLLVVREGFFVGTAGNTSEQNNEAIWYPLSAVTEFIAVVLFAVPGLVPDTPKDL